MQRLAVLLDVAGQNLLVVAPSVIAAGSHRLADDDPRIVVAEDARILLVAFGIGADFTHLDMIGGEGRIVEHDAVFAFQAFFYRVERTLHESFFQTDARHGAPAL